MSLDLSKRNIKVRGVYAFETLKESWVVGFQHLVPLLLAWLFSLFLPVLALALGVIGGLFIDAATGFKHGGLATILGTLIPGAWIAWTWPGWVNITLKVVRGQSVHRADMLRPLSQVWSAIVVLVLTTICCGLLSCTVVLGALLYLKWQLAPYYVVDRNYGAMQALKQSWHDTNRVFIPLCLLDLMFVVLHAGTGFTFVGPFLCFIASSVATALVYQKWLVDDVHLSSAEKPPAVNSPTDSSINSSLDPAATTPTDSPNES